MRGTMVLLLLGALLTIGVGPATADVFYASEVFNKNGASFGQSTLVTIDSTTGLITSTINPITTSLGVAANDVLSVGGLAFNPSATTLYGVGKVGSGLGLVTINTTNGVATQVGSGLGAVINGPGITSASVTGITFAPNGTLYAVIGVTPNGGSTSFNLYSIDTTSGLASNPALGTVTPSTGGNSVAYRPGATNSGLYFASGTALDTLNSSNGQSSPLFNPLTFDSSVTTWVGAEGGVQPPGLRFSALDFSSDGSTLYGVLLNGNPNLAAGGGVASALATINLNNGDVDLVSPTDQGILGPGSPGNPAGTNSFVIEAIALDDPTNVPEPGSLALLTATAAGALGYSLRRRRAASQQPISA